MCWSSVRGFVGIAGRHVFGANRLAVSAVEIDRLPSDQVDDTAEVGFAADGQLHEHGVAAELVVQLPDDLVRVGACAIHLVDEGQPRDMVALHLAVNGQRLRLNSANGAEDEDRPVQYTQAALDLDGEIDVAGRVDHVDRGAVPLHRRRGAGDGDATFPLEVHVVERCAFAALAVDFLHAVDSARIEQNTLAQGRLTRVDVRRYADISKTVQIHRSNTRYVWPPRRTQYPARLPVLPGDGCGCIALENRTFHYT